jgi:transposase
MGKRKFTPEFKRSAVALVVEQNYTREEAARNLGIKICTLDNWLHAHRRLNGAAGVAEELDLKKRVAQLERELARTRMERDILKKATAYFAKEQL